MVVLRCRTPRQVRGGWRLASELALILVGMLIFSERTWKHHCVTLALPFAVLAYVLARVPMRRGIRFALAIGLIGAVGLMISASGLLSPRAADLAQVYGVYLWAFLILLAALVLTRRANSAQDAGPDWLQSPTHPA